MYGPMELDSQVSRESLSCIEKTGVEYSEYVEKGGPIVVIPSDHR